MSKVQPKLFSTAVGNACGWKVFVGTNNREVRYFNVDDRIVRVDIGAGEVPVSVQSHGRHDVVIPGYGQV